MDYYKYCNRSIFIWNGYKIYIYYSFSSIKIGHKQSYLLITIFYVNISRLGIAMYKMKTVILYYKCIDASMSYLVSDCKRKEVNFRGRLNALPLPRSKVSCPPHYFTLLIFGQYWPIFFQLFKGPEKKILVKCIAT